MLAGELQDKWGVVNRDVKDLWCWFWRLRVGKQTYKVSIPYLGDAWHVPGGASGPQLAPRDETWHSRHQFRFIFLHLVRYLIWLCVLYFGAYVAERYQSSLDRLGHWSFFVSWPTFEHGGRFGALCSQRSFWGLWGTGANSIAALYTYVETLGCVYSVKWQLKLDYRKCCWPHELRAQFSPRPRNIGPNQLEERQCVWGTGALT